jgi:hypothetical protein
VFYAVDGGVHAVDPHSYLVLNHGQLYTIAIDATSPVESFCLFFDPGFAETVYHSLYLLGKGARMDLFTAAMLGELSIVRAILTAFPHMRHQRGPHGISLLSHARQGGKDAEAVVAYLEAFDATL